MARKEGFRSLGPKPAAGRTDNMKTRHKKSKIKVKSSRRGKSSHQRSYKGLRTAKRNPTSQTMEMVGSGVAALGGFLVTDVVGRVVASKVESENAGNYALLAQAALATAGLVGGAYIRSSSASHYVMAAGLGGAINVAGNYLTVKLFPKLGIPGYTAGLPAKGVVRQLRRAS